MSRTYRMPRTEAGAVRQARALVRQYRRAFSGGFTFGMDARTWAINQPEAAAHYMRMVAAFPQAFR